MQLSEFMIKLNEKRDNGNLASAESWSIRNLEIIINRMAEQKKCNENYLYKKRQYENCELHVNVLFYVLSYIDDESVNESFKQIKPLIKDCFQLNEEQAEELQRIYDEKPEIQYDNVKFILRKDKSKIYFQNDIIKIKNINHLNKLSSLLNSLFNCLLCADTEPILLIGPTGY